MQYPCFSPLLTERRYENETSRIYFPVFIFIKHNFVNKLLFILFVASIASTGNVVFFLTIWQMKN